MKLSASGHFDIILQSFFLYASKNTNITNAILKGEPSTKLLPLNKDIIIMSFDTLLLVLRYSSPFWRFELLILIIMFF